MVNTGRGQDRSPRVRLDSDARRAAILAAAVEEFAAGPYDGVTTSSIAARAHASGALVFRYFGSKASLYAEVVALSIEKLRASQQERVAAVPSGAPVRDRVRAGLEATVDHIATHPSAWANPLRGGTEPPEAQRLRADSRRQQTSALAVLLRASDSTRDRFALEGYAGMVEAMCLHWVDGGCRSDEREPLIAAALGGLEGALGDWRR